MLTRPYSKQLHNLSRLHCSSVVHSSDAASWVPSRNIWRRTPGWLRWAGPVRATAESRCSGWCSPAGSLTLQTALHKKQRDGFISSGCRSTKRWWDHYAGKPWSPRTCSSWGKDGTETTPSFHWKFSKIRKTAEQFAKENECVNIVLVFHFCCPLLI